MAPRRCLSIVRLVAETIAQLVVGLTFAVGTVVAVIAATNDQRTRLLLNTHNAVLAGVAAAGFSLAAVIDGDLPPLGRLLGGAAVFAGPWLLANLVAPSSIGFGDVKYSAALGLYLGWIDPLLGLTAIIVSGLVVMVAFVVRRLRRRSDEEVDRTFAFGPFLCVGAVVAAVLGLLAG